MKRLIEYIKDNPKGYWFKRKLYGWGWVPVRWQGWVVVLAFIVFVLWCAFDLVQSSAPSDTELTSFLIKIIGATILLVAVCLFKGEKPHWQWGLPKDK